MAAAKVQSTQNSQGVDYACADSTPYKMTLVAAAVCLVILIEIWTISFFVGVVAFPNGAPTSACFDLRPYHGARLTGFAIDEIRDEAAPFVIKTKQINPSSYKGVISGTIPFRAFMVQARVDTSQKAVGKFIRFDGGMTKTLSCSQTDDTITHTDDNPKQQITFVWHVDDFDMPESRIHFVATVAKTYSEFWTNVTSEAITIGSPITEMAATKSVTLRRQLVPEEKRGTGSRRVTSSDRKDNEDNSRKHRQNEWHQLPDGREVLETEGIHFPPEMKALFQHLPIQPNGFLEHQHLDLNHLLVPIADLEPKTSTLQTPLVLKVNVSLAQEASNLPRVKTGSEPNKEGREAIITNQSTTVQAREQRVIGMPGSLVHQTTPEVVDLPRTSLNSLGASSKSNLSLPLYAAIFALIAFK